MFSDKGFKNAFLSFPAAAPEQRFEGGAAAAVGVSGPVLRSPEGISAMLALTSGLLTCGVEQISLAVSILQ